MGRVITIAFLIFFPTVCHAGIGFGGSPLPVLTNKEDAAAWANGLHWGKGTIKQLEGMILKLKEKIVEMEAKNKRLLEIGKLTWKEKRAIADIFAMKEAYERALEVLKQYKALGVKGASVHFGSEVVGKRKGR